MNVRLVIITALAICSMQASAENGYDLWLRYKKIENKELLSRYTDQLGSYFITSQTPTGTIIKNELNRGLGGLLGNSPRYATDISSARLVIAQHQELGALASHFDTKEIKSLGKEGFHIKRVKNKLILTANTDIGLLYGAFALLRKLQNQSAIKNLETVEIPKIDVRILNHWDNLDRTSERGYAGFSIWDWHRLPEYLDQRYIDYARANASIGINGTVLTNVNANALVLTPTYLEKVKALADLFRPYGIKVYLTARFSAPMGIGELETADPLNPDVKRWWQEKTNEIYKLIPDFGGFLVKANSEGQPGPQNYSRTHAEGANMLADALKPHSGIVMWRAFVYSNEEPEDRAKQAYNEFTALDGKFRENVLVQVKNGPIDFQPREPFHPLFGAMPKTPVMMEFQITQEYLGQATQLVYLAPMYKECLQSDTYMQGKGSTVARVIDGSLHNYSLTGVAGVANIGTDINWTGHPMAQSNWYAFGRLAWDHTLHSENIAEEWIRMTYNNGTETVNTIKSILMSSWEAAVDYMTPLGLHHLMGPGHHYGPGPWVSDMPRADWTSVYYHKADAQGIGFDRSPTGSNAAGQYAPEVAKVFGSVDNIPEKFLLWFHHVPWDHKMASGRTLWNELAYRYQRGINTVRDMRNEWKVLEEKIDAERYRSVNMLLKIQEKEAIWWKDASLLYFQTFSDLPIPDYVEKPEKKLEYYRSLRFPYAPGIRPRW